jgi:ABC-type uncharacterized transport system substrate-binding protein
MPGTADNAEYQLGNAAFLQALGELGWIVGPSVHIDYRWGAGDVERYRAIATDLVSLAPDAVLAEGYASVSALQKATRSVPIWLTAAHSGVPSLWVAFSESEIDLFVMAITSAEAVVPHPAAAEMDE